MSPKVCQYIRETGCDRVLLSVSIANLTLWPPVYFISVAEFEQALSAREHGKLKTGIFPFNANCITIAYVIGTIYLQAIYIGTTQYHIYLQMKSNAVNSGKFHC